MIRRQIILTYPNPPVPSRERMQAAWEKIWNEYHALFAKLLGDE